VALSFTMACRELVAPRAVARISVAPTPTALTRPDASTRAMLVSADDQST
jgi:hypothetical protein